MKDIINPLSRTMLVAILLMAGLNLLGLIIAHLIGVMITVGFGALFLLREATWLKTSTFQKVSNKKLVSYSLPLMFAGIIYTFIGQVDYFMIGFFMTSSDVGFYRVAFLLSSNLLIVLSAITPIFKPMISEKRGNADIIKHRFRLATRWITMLTIPIAITFILAPGVYLSIFFTPRYAVAGATVMALTVGYLLNASFGPEGMTLEGLGFTRLTLFNTVILIIVNVTLDALLIPHIGILGAGIATGSALSLTGLAGVLELYYLKDVHPFTSDLVLVWVAGIITILPGWLMVHLIMDLYLIALSLPFVVVISYVIVLRSIGGFTNNDAKVAKRVDSKIGYPVLESIFFR